MLVAIGALVLRGAFIAVGAILIESFSWVLHVFAAFLIYTGHRMIRQRNNHVHLENSRVLRVSRRFVPMTDAFHEQRLLIRRAVAAESAGAFRTATEGELDALEPVWAGGSCRSPRRRSR